MKTALVLILLLAATPVLGAEVPARTALRFEIEAGPLLGLDRVFRGVEAELLLGLDIEGLGAVLSLGFEWDRSLGSLAGLAELGLALGPGLALFAGAELPFAGQAAESGGGSRIGLEPASWPCRFGFSALLAERAAREGRPGTALVAELSYSAYRVTGLEALGGGPVPPLEEATAGLAGFALGFRAELALRLSWPLGPRTQSRVSPP